jgi:hypothetical protein
VLQEKHQASIAGMVFLIIVIGILFRKVFALENPNLVVYLADYLFSKKQHIFMLRLHKHALIEPNSRHPRTLCWESMTAGVAAYQPRRLAKEKPIKSAGTGEKGK